MKTTAHLPVRKADWRRCFLPVALPFLALLSALWFYWPLLAVGLVVAVPAAVWVLHQYHLSCDALIWDGSRFRASYPGHSEALDYVACQLYGQLLAVLLFRGEEGQWCCFCLTPASMSEYHRRQCLALIHQRCERPAAKG